MLVLSRKRGEAITISDVITLKVIEIRGNRVKLGFDCPDDVRILREEVINGFTRQDCDAGRSAAEMVAT